MIKSILVTGLTLAGLLALVALVFGLGLILVKVALQAVVWLLVLPFRVILVLAGLLASVLALAFKGLALVLVVALAAGALALGGLAIVLLPLLLIGVAVWTLLRWVGPRPLPQA